MVKDHSNTEKGNPLPPLHRLLFLISSKGFIYMRHSTDRIVHVKAFLFQSSHNGKKWMNDYRPGVGNYFFHGAT